MNIAAKYLKRIATGDFSQGQAFWTILVPTLLIVKAGSALLALFNVIQNPVISTRIWLLVAAFIFFILLPTMFFGTTRAILIYKRKFKGGAQSVILLMGTVFVAYLCVSQITKHFDYLVNMGKIAAAHDDMSLELTVSESGDTLYLNGQLSYGATKSVKAFLNKNESVSTVDLNIGEGHLHEARALAQLVIKSELNTQVTQRCAASCMLVLVGGIERTVSSDAVLQFHRTLDYENGYRSDWIIDRERGTDQAYYKRRAVRDSYIFPIYYKQKNDDYLQPSLDILLANGVITKITP
jgi:hypothetical protein